MSQSRTIAFIGLGIMGLPMAANLVSAGFTVRGYDRSPQQADRLAGKGGTAAATPAEAVSGADVVITMVPDSPDVEEAVFSTGGVFDSAAPGTLVVDMSTVRPDTARAVNEEGAKRGLRVLDAPVSGGEAGAVEGVLSIMVGGDPADFDAAAGVFAPMGSAVLVGPAGAGQTVKAANQLIVAGNIQLVAEALVFLEAHGVETEAGLRVLNGGLAGSTVLTRKAESMRHRRFEPGFRIELHDKDMGIVTAAAREVGVPVPMGALVAQFIGALKAQGHGGLDHSALLKLVDQLAAEQK
ncbi:2-hydroxy-3-oxopropionate reductase [Streptomonospora litoralis]|uniref:2-hydroxy-3-oxopropionate reductase n=1 Tax=Streptomonospora litoralis TaxID=2498135 RepID=A0A4P6PYW2_9ACTN|nr:2-hydroxy-3-oxopropionate reductase [Streptomonospora litoralis]QBI53323.1 2-hydroxy-3-oxopropionate reductase [Streptomonospora litoralis]